MVIQMTTESETGHAKADEIRRLQRALSRVMRPESIESWLGTPNEAFSGLRPIEVIERGEADRIRRMIHELESGTPT